MAPREESHINSVNSGDESDASSVGDGDYRKYRVRRTNLIGMVNWSHVLSTYFPQLFICGIGVLVSLIFKQVVNDSIPHDNLRQDNVFEVISVVIIGIRDLLMRQVDSIMSLRKEALFAPEVEVTFVALLVMFWYVRLDNPEYLLSFSTFKAPDSWKLSHDQIIECMRGCGHYTEESLAFMKRLLNRSETGQSTAWPPGIVQVLKGKPRDKSIQASRDEAETVIFDIVENALKKAKLSPKDIDVLVINCSIFSPTPSLCASVITRFQMKSDILSYNLSGMGCGASLLAMDLAKNTLRSSGGFGRGKRALVVSTEIITPCLYEGNERAFLLQNTLFRCGGAAMILSNKWMDGSRAWFKLLHTVRVQGTSDEAFQCVYETEDKIGERGIRLSKEIVKVAGKTMSKNFTTLGPYILPLSEQAKVVVSLAARFVCRSLNATFKTKKFPIVKVYVPDFKTGVDHFCIHAGGRAVIDGIEKNMKLETYHTEPSRMTLLNFGNTSSSSIWYELEYIMDQQKSNPLKKGDRVLQVAFGSGFKCTSGVWMKL